MNEKTSYIFVGQSGAGKGTQVRLLEKKLSEKSPLWRFFHLETGAIFRAMSAEQSYIISRTKEYILEGKLPPSFLGVHAWAHALIYTYNAEDILFIDGTPRIIEEVPVLLGALSFIGSAVTIIHIDVGDEWAYERTHGRGREDDHNEKELRGRIAWYHEQVAPVIDYLKKDPSVTYLHINGEDTIEHVHEAILKAISV